MKEFKSQICTTREQSKRLLELGLKKETADMYYSCDIICAKPYYKVVEFMNGCVPEDIFPAWSLHRLIEMALRDILICGISFTFNEDAYEKVIRIIEHQIKEGYLKKDYLADKK